MYCLKPLTITPAMLTSSIAEVDTGETAWVSGTTYALADVRTYSTRKYERLVAGAGTTTPDLDPTKWLDVGPTNKWAMFDTLRNTQSSAASTITVSIVPGQRISALALMQCNATSATVTMTVGGTTVYSSGEINMLAWSPTNWLEYFLGMFRRKRAIFLCDLPLYTDATTTVTITSSSGPVSIGALCIGLPVFVGGIQYDPTSGTLNFSSIDRDTFGNTNLIPRRLVPTTNQIAWIDKAAVNSLINLRADTDAVPCVWSGLDDDSNDGYFDALLILGIHREFLINMSYPKMAKVTLQLEEV